MNIRPMVEPILQEIIKRPDNSIATTKQLVDAVYGEPVHFGHEYYYDDGFEMTDEDYSVLGKALLFACAAKGITLDAARYYEKVIGLPADADYVIRKLRP